jgi:hypothetical protein
VLALLDDHRAFLDRRERAFAENSWCNDVTGLRLFHCMER